ncbi:hypothetical protein V6N13_138266 [Hibiscus sabdariffa]|uniref:Lipoxygenase domain-containing protein n=1 Tax=Hibiscus sabdariffa TaxID=183260 RepID=A0ABR2QDE6_9ROSI
MNTHPSQKAYATPTIFFLTQLQTLKSIAIELSLPPMNPYMLTKRVITPHVDATTCWQWQLARGNVFSNDCGAHELIQHWLRTHGDLIRRYVGLSRSGCPHSMEIGMFNKDRIMKMKKGVLVVNNAQGTNGVYVPITYVQSATVEGQIV